MSSVVLIHHLFLTKMIFHLLNIFQKEISVEEVSFSFDKTKVLENINFKAFKNETLAFVGESGSGKSTLINVITGLLKPDSGKVFIDGNDLTKLSAESFQQKIGYIT